MVLIGPGFSKRALNAFRGVSYVLSMESRATGPWLAILSRPRAVAILVVLALLLAAGAVLLHRHGSGRQPLSLETVAIAPSAIRQEIGRCWVTDLGTTWMSSHRRPSRARLFEDGRALGPANALHESIRNEGGGRFSLWNGQLYFSSSDGTQPPTNGRRYEVVWPTPVPHSLEFGINALVALSSLLAAFAAARSWATGGQAWFDGHVMARIGRVIDWFGGPQGHWRACFVVGLAAMVARVVAVAIVRADPAGHISGALIMGVPFSDAKGWDDQGESIMMGHGLAGPWSARRPFLAFVIGSLYTWTGPMPDVVVALNVLLGAWTAALVCRIGQRVFGPAVGVVAGLAFACDPISLEYCSYLLTETLGTFLFVFSVRQIVAGLQENRASSCWGAGVLFALSNLTRTLTLPAAPVFALAALIAGRKKGGWKRGLVLAVAFGLGLGLPLGSWIVRQKIVHDLTTISDNTASGLYAAASPKYGTWSAMIDREADEAGVSGDIKPRYEWCMQRFREELSANPWFYLRNTLGSGWAGLMTLAGVATAVRWLLVLLMTAVWLSRLPTLAASARSLVPWLLVVAAVGCAIIALPRHGLLLLAAFAMVSASMWRGQRLALLLLGAFLCTIASAAAFALAEDQRLLLMVSWMMPMALANGVLVILVLAGRWLGDKGAAAWVQPISSVFTPRWQTIVVRSTGAFFVVSMSILAFRNFVSPLPTLPPLSRPTVEDAQTIVRRVAELSPGSVATAELADPRTWYSQVGGPDPTPGHGRLVVATLRLERHRYPMCADLKVNHYSRMFAKRSYDRLFAYALDCLLPGGGSGPTAVILPSPWPESSDRDILVVGRANVDRAYIYEENHLEVVAWAPLAPDGKAGKLQVTAVPEHLELVRSLQR